MGFVVGVILVLFGVAVAVPNFGGFGVIWTIAALGITVFMAINAFTSRGLSERVIEFDTPTPSAPASIEERLTKLDELKKSGLVSETEYREQRMRIISEL